MILPVGATLSAASPAGTTSVVTLLGVRFLDLATGRPVTSALVAYAQSLQVPARPVRGICNPSGTLGFHDLPGMGALEHPAGSGPIASPPSPSPFLVMVSDWLGRYLPCLFTVDVPFAGPAGSPPEGLVPLPVLDAPLFSTPARAVPTGFSAVRAELWDRDSDEPVAYALVRATIGDRRCSAVSDTNGQVLVMCPAPVSEWLRLGSPPGRRVGSSPQTLTVTLEVFSSRTLPAAPRLPSGAGVLPQPWRALPPLRAVLEGQPPAQVWSQIGGPIASSWTGELAYGRELIARTTTQSRLWISRSASPP